MAPKTEVLVTAPYGYAPLIRNLSTGQAVQIQIANRVCLASNGVVTVYNGVPTDPTGGDTSAALTGVPIVCSWFDPFAKPRAVTGVSGVITVTGTTWVVIWGAVSASGDEYLPPADTSNYGPSSWSIVGGVEENPTFSMSAGLDGIEYTHGGVDFIDAFFSLGINGLGLSTTGDYPSRFTGTDLSIADEAVLITALPNPSMLLSSLTSPGDSSRLTDSSLTMTKVAGPVSSELSAFGLGFYANGLDETLYAASGLIQSQATSYITFAGARYDTAAARVDLLFVKDGDKFHVTLDPPLVAGWPTT